MSDLDRILSGDSVIEPSAGFAARVMGQVRQEATAPPAIEFPWRRFLPGAITCAAVLLIALGLMIANIDPTAVPVEPEAQLGPAFDIAMLSEPPAIAAIALLGSLVVAWLATRFAAMPRHETF